MPVNLKTASKRALTDVIGFDASGKGGRARFTKLAHWVRRTNSVRTPYGFSASPPAATISAGSTLTSAVNGACSHPVGNAALNFGIDDAFMAAYSGASYILYNQTNTSGSKTRTGGLNRLRFMTDETAFELATLFEQNLRVNMIIEDTDGTKSIAFQNDPAIGPVNNLTTYRYRKYDFGSNTITYEALAATGGAENLTTFVSGGTNYNPGDIVVLAGGSFTTPITIKVVNTSTVPGPIASAQIMAAGVYSAIPSLTFTQTSTSGSGSGVQVASSTIIWGSKHSTRRMRKIELQAHGSIALLGLNVAGKGVILPWPVAPFQPRVLFIGDSQSYGTYLKHACAHMPSRVARLLGLEESYAISADGGTGWNVDNGAAPRWSNAYRIADIIAYNPDIVIFIGSQNDSDNSAAQAAVTATLNSLSSSLPNCIFIGIGSVVSTGSTYTMAGWHAASVYGDRATYIDNVTSPWVTGTGGPGTEATTGNRCYMTASDLVHLSDSGIDEFAMAAARAILDAVRALVG